MENDELEQAEAELRQAEANLGYANSVVIQQAQDFRMVAVRAWDAAKERVARARAAAG